MSNFLSRYSTNKDLEENGQWVAYGDGIEVQIRRLNCTKSKDARRKLEKPYTKQFRNQDLPDDIQEMILNNQIAKAIVADWRGVPNPDSPSDPLPYSEENVLRMIKQFPDFRDDILAASMERATYQMEETKEAEGNSPSSSFGSSDPSPPISI